MAEVSVMPEDVPSGKYYRGDMIHAYNSRAIKHNHCAMINDQGFLPFNSDGLRDAGGHFQKWLDCTYHFRAEKVAGFWELVTLNERGEEIDRTSNHYRLENIDAAIANRLRHPRHRVLGTASAPIYHIKARNKATTDLDVVWNAVETHSIHRATNCPCGVDHSSKLWGVKTLYGKLIVEVDDFNEVEREALLRPHTGEFASGEQIRDHEGLAISPSWKHYHEGPQRADKKVAEYDDATGSYALFGDGSVMAFYTARNLKVDEFQGEVLDALQVTDAQARDKRRLIGRDRTANVDVSKAPFMAGRRNMQRKGNTIRNDPSKLWNRRDKRQGERLLG